MDSQVLQIKWQGKEFEIQLSKYSTIQDLKNRIEEITQIAPYTQKLVGLSKGKLPADDTVISQLNLKNPAKVMLLGLPKAEAEEMQRQELIMQEQREAERIQRELEEKLRREEEQRRIEEENARRLEYEERRRVEQERWEREEGQRQEEYRRRRLADEMASENDFSAVLSFNITCYSSAIANKPSMEFSDKILLPHEMLAEIVSHKLALPLSLRITATNATAANVVHAGVLDFTAPKDTAYLPYNMMKKLGIEEGDSISITNVHLPKGQYVQFLPHSASWLEVPERKSVLENQLRNYQTLTMNDVIKIQYNNETFEFDVTSLVPEEAVSIIDTDINVEVSPPKEQAVTSHEDLKLGDPIKDAVNKEEYRYYSFTVEDPSFVYTFDCNAISGDIDLYVSTMQKKPTKVDFIWGSQHLGSNSVTVSQDDTSFIVGKYYIAVHGYANESKFELKVTATEKKNVGHTLKDVQMSDVDSTYCDNCLKNVPTSSFQMHQINCQRRNYRCTKCNEVMPVGETTKHNELKHTLLTCQCGIQLEQEEMMIHKTHQCSLRLIKCLYCPLQFASRDIGSHQNLCGARTVSCKHCNSVVKRFEVKLHMKREHEIVVEEINAESEWEHVQ